MNEKTDENNIIDENNENIWFKEDKTESETNIKPKIVKFKSEKFTGVFESSNENIQFGAEKQIDIKLPLNDQQNTQNATELFKSCFHKRNDIKNKIS